MILLSAKIRNTVLDCSYKYRRIRVCYQGDEKTNQNKAKTIAEYRTGDRTEHDLIFAVYQNAKMPNPNMIYDDLARSFAEAYCEHYNTFTSSFEGI